MGVREEILALAQLHSGGKSNDTQDVDLFGTFALEGGDAEDFLVAYMEKYGVDMSDFRWEFHYIGDEPPGHRRVLPMDANGKVIPFIPVPLDQFVRAAEGGIWHVTYPEHTIKYSLRSRLFLPILALIVVALAVVLWRIKLPR